MGNRAMRRRAMKYERDKYKKLVESMTIQQINERILQQGIGQADLDKALNDGRKSGFTEGGKLMTEVCYAAAIRVLCRDYGFDQEKLVEFLTEMDLMTLTVLDHREMIRETLEETGIELRFNDGVDRVQVRKPREVLCDRCMIGNKVSPGSWDCEALDGMTAGRTACSFFMEARE